ncbi:MAG: type II toxin-antitoxin system VapC family toxin [Thermodesulfobacteriota bacterium]|nr:type II toxin-antitoxin system VapC family toxin [Thermodesulfobacteriota bacterium]
MINGFVVDNSVVMSWCFKDKINRYADAVLDKLSESTAIAPSIWPLEVVNVLLVAERRKRLKQADSVRFITLLSQLPIVVEDKGSEKVMKDLLALGRTSHLSSYDAFYLDLAMRKDCPIATMDKKLMEAAKEVSVTILEF